MGDQWSQGLILIFISLEKNNIKELTLNSATSHHKVPGRLRKCTHVKTAKSLCRLLLQGDSSSCSSCVHFHNALRFGDLFLVFIGLKS